MLAGFRSRWMMPCSCAASSASAICRQSAAPRRAESAPRAMRCDKILALDQFHDQRTDAARSSSPWMCGDVGMVERRERLGLAGEPGETFGSLANGRAAP